MDASVVANFLAEDGHAGRVARVAVSRAEGVSLPDLADVETAAVLRKRWIARKLTDERFATALATLANLPFRRHPALAMLQRAYELRATVTVYDAMYVALAEALGCPLLTADIRLARAPGPRCEIQVLRPA